MVLFLRWVSDKVGREADDIPMPNIFLSPSRCPEYLHLFNFHLYLEHSLCQAAKHGQDLH